MKNKLKKQRGFTILESIVAIFILSLSISGAFSAVQQGLSQSIIAKDEVKAFYLAQEAIEIIRNKRDTNQLTIMGTGAGHWLAGISQNSDDPCSPGKICQVSANPPYSLSITECGTSWDSCTQYLKQDTQGSSPTFLYGYTSGTETNFKRAVQIESINPNEISVTVRVSWKKGSLPEFVFKAKTLLFNWI